MRSLLLFVLRYLDSLDGNFSFRRSRNGTREKEGDHNAYVVKQSNQEENLKKSMLKVDAI